MKKPSGSLRKTNETRVKMYIVSGKFKEAVCLCERCGITPKRLEKLIIEIGKTI